MERCILKSIKISILFIGVFLSAIDAIAQSKTEANPLANTGWVVELPQGKEYETVLNFSDSVYSNTFSYNGESCTVKKIYRVCFPKDKSECPDCAVGKIQLPYGGAEDNTLIDKFNIIELSDSTLILRNIQTGVVITCVASKRM